MQRELKPITDATQGTGSLVGPHQPPRELAVPATGTERRLVPAPPATLTVTDGTTAPLTPPPSSSSRTIDVTSGGPADQHPTREAPVAPTASTDPSHDPVQRRGTEASSPAEPPPAPDDLGVRRGRDLPPPPPPPVPPPTAFPGPEEPERPRTANDLPGEPTTDATADSPSETTAIIARVVAAEAQARATRAADPDRPIYGRMPSTVAEPLETTIRERPELIERAEGYSLFSDREKEVLDLYKQGLSNQEVAARVGISARMLWVSKNDIGLRIRDGVPTDIQSSPLTFRDGREVLLASQYLPEDEVVTAVVTWGEDWLPLAADGSRFATPYASVIDLATHTTTHMADEIDTIVTEGIGSANTRVDHDARMATVLINTPTLLRVLSRYEGLATPEQLDRMAEAAIAQVYQNADTLTTGQQGYYNKALSTNVHATVASELVGYRMQAQLARHLPRLLHLVQQETRSGEALSLQAMQRIADAFAADPTNPVKNTADFVLGQLQRMYPLPPDPAELLRAEEAREAARREQELIERQRQVQLLTPLTRLIEYVIERGVGRPGVETPTLNQLRIVCIKLLPELALTERIQEALKFADAEIDVDLLRDMVAEKRRKKPEGSLELTHRETGRIIHGSSPLVGQALDKLRRLWLPKFTDPDSDQIP